MSSLDVSTIFSYPKEDCKSFWDGLPFDVEVWAETVLEDSLKFMFKESMSYDGTVDISCLFADDDESQALNNQYRGKNKPTNVLSFGFLNTPFNKDAIEALDPELPFLLGDIVLSYTRIKVEAEEQQKTFKNHFTHLLVHSLLHLLGYDHEQEDEAAEMEALERDILKQFGLSDPYLIDEEAPID